MRHMRLSSDRGFAAILALIMVGMLTLIGLAALSTSDDEMTIAGNELQETRSFYAAEAGLERAASVLQSVYDSTGHPPVTMPVGYDTMNSCQVTYSTSDNGAAEQRRLTQGSLTGLNALVKTYSINSTAESALENAKVLMSELFEAAAVPIFQFAVFYENDLWATPAYDLVITGRVHVNGNMYLQASTELSFDSRVTAAGSIYHGFPSWSGVSTVNGNVSFKDASGNYQSMLRNGSWLDASKSTWYDSASTRWQGMVRDKAFGEKKLNLPLTNGSTDAHKIIERATNNPDSYERKATLLILKGVPYAKFSGVWQDISGMLPTGTITATTFYDAREKKTVNSTDVDIAKLATSGYFPPNGVVYSSDDRTGFNATRLVNATSLSQPLSVFCENPVYVKGDFNTVNKQPAAIVADAVTYLSNSWTDAKSTSSLSSRTVTPTTVNVSMITGDCTPTSSSYGGGVSNLPRFLESWNEKQFTYRGSMVALWRSKQATGTWRYGGSDAYYVAPSRDYSFDTDLNDPANLPPETPCILVYQRVGWKQEYVGRDT